LRRMDTGQEASVNILVDVALMAYEIDLIWGNE
jgi:hypothetical protein